MENKSDLKKKALSGGIWKILERICTSLVELVVSLTLTRLLIPEDYSVVSIVLIFSSVCNTIIQGDLSSALIQKKDSDTKDFSTVFLFNMVIALILYIVMFLVAPLIAELYKKPILTSLVRVMGLNFFIDGYNGLVSSYVYKKLQFKKYFQATIFGTAISAIVGIVMAVKGFGPWSLVAQGMTNSLIDAIILTVSSRFKIMLYFSFHRLKPLVRFSWKLFVSNLVNVGFDQVKPIIIGLKFSTTDLAYYNKGQSLPSKFNSVLTGAVGSVVFSTFSKLQDNKEQLLSAVRRYIKLSSFFIFPILIGLFVVSETFVKIVFTEKWISAVPFLRLFCFVYLLSLIRVGNREAIRALGRSDIILITNILDKICTLSFIIIFVMISHNAFMFSLSNILIAVVDVLTESFPNRRLLGYSYKSQIIDISKNLSISIVMGFCVYLLKFLNLNEYILLLCQVFLGLVLYICLNLLVRNENLYYVFDLIKNLIRQKRI